MNRIPVTILMTCAGGSLIPAELTMMRLSPTFEYKVIGTDLKDVSEVPWAGMLTEYQTVPIPSHPDYLSTIKRLCAVHEVDLIIPRSDEEAQALTHSNLRIPILSSPSSVMETILNKEATYITLDSAGVRIPEFAVVLDQAGAYGWDIFKPIDSRGGRGLTNSPTTFPVLGMKMLVEPAYDVDCVWMGTRHLVVVRKRVNPVGIPFRGCVIVNNPEVRVYCQRICEVLGLRGVHDMDLMTNPKTGDVELLEVNPRASASIIGAMIEGYPVWDLAVRAKFDLEV